MAIPAVSARPGSARHGAQLQLQGVRSSRRHGQRRPLWSVSSKAAKEEATQVPQFDLDEYMFAQLASDRIVEYDGEDIEDLADQFNIEPWITIQEGPHGYPYVHLQHINGSRAVVSLQGGVVTSWSDENGEELLYMHPDNDYHPARPLRGGVQFAFPQYNFGTTPTAGARGIPQHGFTREQHWNLIATSMAPSGDMCPTVSMNLYNNRYTRSMFPHEFELIYHVSLNDYDGGGDVADVPGEYDMTPPPDKFAAAGASFKGKVQEEPKEEKVEAEPLDPPHQLGLTIEVVNTGPDAFEFQAATFADLAVRDLTYHAQSVRMLGVTGRFVIDYSQGNPALMKEDMDFVYPLTPPGTRMDRAYIGTDDTDVLFCPGDLQHFELVFRSGFKDTVIAHPDIEEVEFSTHYVTLGGGNVGAPVRIEPGMIWLAEFAFRRHRQYWRKPYFETNGTPMPGGLEEPPATMAD